MKMFHVKRQLLALFLPGFFIGNFICQSGSGAVCSGGRDFQRIFFETIPGGRYSDGRVYLVFAAGPSFAVFSAAGICFYKIQKSGSYSVLDLDGLFCRTSVFYGSSRDGSKREHPVHCRNAPPVFMLYSSVSDRGVVCVLLPAYAVEYTEKSGFRRSSFSWYRVRTVCKSGFGRRIFENPLSRDEMF